MIKPDKHKHLLVVAVIGRWMADDSKKTATRHIDHSSRAGRMREDSKSGYITNMARQVGCPLVWQLGFVDTPILDSSCAGNDLTSAVCSQTPLSTRTGRRNSREATRDTRETIDGRVRLDKGGQSSSLLDSLISRVVGWKIHGRHCRSQRHLAGAKEMTSEGEHPSITRCH
ncbi:hypothetical protein BaRGS_00022670, partial [Batillaria attramentaria]